MEKSHRDKADFTYDSNVLLFAALLLLSPAFLAIIYLALISNSKNHVNFELIEEQNMVKTNIRLFIDNQIDISHEKALAYLKIHVSKKWVAAFEASIPKYRKHYQKVSKRREEFYDKYKPPTYMLILMLKKLEHDDLLTHVTTEKELPMSTDHLYMNLKEDKRGVFKVIEFRVSHAIKTLLHRYTMLMSLYDEVSACNSFNELKKLCVHIARAKKSIASEHRMMEASIKEILEKRQKK